MARPHSPTVRKAQAPADPALAFQDDALLNADPATINRTLDQMKAAGARNLRVNAIYGQSRANGAYDWSKLDTLVNAARARGIAPQMTLMGTPEYMRARNLDMGLSAATPNQNLMGAFARDAATHFRGRVGRYSVWNEPNIASFLAEGENKAGPKLYRQLYQAGYKAIKGADPHAKVLLGELTAGRQGADPKAQALGFLRRVLAAGNKPLRADGLALHPYQWSDPNQKMNDANYGGISNLPGAAGALARVPPRQADDRRQAPLQGPAVPDRVRLQGRGDEPGHPREVHAPGVHARAAGRCAADALVSVASDDVHAAGGAERRPGSRQ
jgi:hypothetical protein